MSESFSIQNSFVVPFEYRVIFGDGVLEPGNATLRDVLAPARPDRPVRAIAFVDEGLVTANPRIVPAIAEYFAAHRSHITPAGPTVVVPGGEKSKSDSCAFDQCIRALHAARLDRHSYAIAIGGGAVLDAVGFAASVVHRGIRQIRIPTTVLSQNDAGIGVKNGIDYEGTKNFLGSFFPPHAVINDFDLLRTLPAHAWRNGIAEAVKVGLIRDPAFYQWIEDSAATLARADEPAMRRLIRRCAELHLQHIATGGDPFERGSARPLDFGHWSAHRLEQLSNFSINHGHAVAVGMAIDAAYSHATGLLDEPTAARIAQCLRSLGFDLAVGIRAGITNPAGVDSLLRGLADFQEHLGGNLSVTMLRGIGRPVEVGQIDHATMRRCITNVLLTTPCATTVCGKPALAATAAH